MIVAAASDLVAAAGAFLTGVAAVLASLRGVRRVRSKERGDCDRRVAELESMFRKGYRQGMKIERRST